MFVWPVWLIFSRRSGLGTPAAPAVALPGGAEGVLLPRTRPTDDDIHILLQMKCLLMSRCRKPGQIPVASRTWTFSKIRGMLL